MPITIRALIATVAGEEFMAHLEQLLAGGDYQESETEEPVIDLDDADEEEVA